MTRLIAAAISCSLIFLVPTVTYAISAQWDLDPISGDWNTAANWTPDEVPNGPADIATFGLSHTTDVSISEDTEVNGITFTSAATNPYTITVNAGVTLTLSGTGITNNSGGAQTLVIGSDDNAEPAQIHFTHGATAGNATIDFSNFEVTNSMQFSDRSSAGSATINFGDFSTISFFNHSTAGSAAINLNDKEGNSVDFFDHSTAGSATIGGTVGGFFNRITFHDHSTAGSALIGIGDSGLLLFSDHSSAGTATISTNAGFSQVGVEFSDFSTAGSATIHVEPATGIDFVGSSRGGTCAIELFGDIFDPSYLDIRRHNSPGVTIGSLEGSEGSFVFLGANNLTIGSNNLSTTFSGEIGGTGGSLTKIGSGTLILSGANTYTGNTNVNRGVLQVDGSITSNTFVNRGGTLAGTGTINGNVTNNGKVSPGSAGAPGRLTVVHNYTQAQYATLMIQIAGASAGQFSVLDILGTANLNGLLNPDLFNGFVPTVGETFTFLNYGAVNGTLSIFNPNIDDLPEHWEVSYFPTFAVLTVVAGNLPVPDQGSTFLFLTLGLLGVITFQRQLVRKQS